ncbi:MAG: T9SS type A sorting domain-containing protein [bacterium]|nr:T9SS type A sorting domain-containing protein [bacterium]
MKKTLLLLFMVSFISTGFSQISFYRLFGGEDFDYAYDVVELPDSGFIVAGTSGSFNVGHADAFLLRTDKFGNRLWSIPYGGPENDGAFDLEHKEGFGTYMLGRTTAPTGDFDAWIAFVDDQGSVLWEKSYPGPNWEEVTESAMTQDSGLIVSVSRYGTNTQSDDYSLIRLDVSGDTVWHQEVNSYGDDEVTNIESYQDSMFLISSNHWDSLNAASYGLIELLHENGSLIWSDSVAISPGSTYLNDFYHVNDTLFGVGGFLLDDTSTFDRMRHVRYLPLAENGEIVTQSSASAGNIIDDVVIPVPNSQFKLGAFRFQDPTTSSPYNDFYVTLNSYLLVPIGATANSGTEGGDDRLFNGAATQDGGAIFVGYQALPQGGTAIAMLKVGPGFDYPTIPEVPFILQLVGQEEIEMLNSVTVYPNPATDLIHVEIDKEVADRYTLVTLAGREVHSGDFSNSEAIISVSSIERGMYFLQLFNKETYVGSTQVIVH